jgi:hypothetical protein
MSNRSRSNTVAAVNSVEYANVGHGTFGSSVITINVPGYTSMDEVFTDTERGPQNDNDCHHYRLDAEEPRTNFGRAHSNDPAPMTNYWLLAMDSAAYMTDYYATFTGSLGQHGDAGLENLKTTNLTDLVNKQDIVDAAMQATLPKLDPALSLLNTILETRDFKRLFPLVQRIKDHLSRLNSSNWNREWVMRRNLRLSAEAYLADQFGIRPMLRDLISLWNGATNIDHELSKLISRAGRRQRRYYRTDVSSSFTAPGSATRHHDGPTIYGGDNVKRELSYLGPIQCVVRIIYDYGLPDGDYERLRKLAYLDKLGLNLNPAILWNAIPWSFVIDWFLGVGKWLNQFAVPNFRIVTNIRSATLSVKLIRKLTLSFEPSVGGPSSPGYVVARTSTEETYSRIAFVPDLYRHLTSSGLNLKEFSYIGALLAARL